MQLSLARPDRVRVHLVDRPDRTRRGARTPTIGDVVGLATRGLLAGVGLGVLVVAGDNSVLSVGAVGLLGITAAMTSWGP
jgi:hypothetical protein